MSILLEKLRAPIKIVPSGTFKAVDDLKTEAADRLERYEAALRRIERVSLCTSAASIARKALGEEKP